VNKVNIRFLLAGLVLLPGCIRVPSYNRKPLKSISDSFTYYGVEKNIIVQVKRLTEDNIQYLFGSRSQQKDDSFEVIYLSVHNISPIPYLLFAADIDCTMLPYKEVIKRLKTSSITRLVGSIVPIHVIAYPSAYLLVSGAFLSVPIAAYAGISLAIAGVGLGLACVGAGIKSIVMNTHISKDIKEKIVPKKVIIKSGDHYEGLIFVKSSDYKPQFKVTMHEYNNNECKIIFDVNLSNLHIFPFIKTTNYTYGLS